MFAAFTAAVHRSAIDGRYAAFMASFTVIIAMDSALIYFANADIRNGAFYLLRPYIEIGGASAMIAALPRFIHSFSDVPGKKALNLAFTLIGVVSFAVGILWIKGLIRGALTYTDFIMIVGVIAYSVTAGYIYGAVWPARGVPRVQSARWGRIMGLVTVLTIAFIPLFIAIDFFPGILPFLSGRLPSSFRTYPFFFLLWNLIYIIHTLPTYRRGISEVEEWSFNRFELSPREREVAALLLEGLSYREIAEKLYVSLATVKTHVNRIYEKTGAGNKMELSRMLRSPAARAEQGQSGSRDPV